ncbi:hypothetical protein [Vibrio quintilis]|nr:hypothetical protein [Vibrio quintilis]
MMQLEKLCQTMPKLSYHSATDTKPTVIHLHCAIEQTRLNDFLFRQQFLQTGQSTYQIGMNQLRISDIRHGMIQSIELTKY